MSAIIPLFRAMQPIGQSSETLPTMLSQGYTGLGEQWACDNGAGSAEGTPAFVKAWKSGSATEDCLTGSWAIQNLELRRLPNLTVSWKLSDAWNVKRDEKCGGGDLKTYCCRRHAFGLVTSTLSLMFGAKRHVPPHLSP